MTPPPAAARLPLLGCALVVALALVLPSCGDEGTAAPDSATARQPAAKAKARAMSAPGGCPNQVAALVKSLDALRSQLAVGLSYEQYAAKVKGLRAAYDEIPVERLALDCLAATGIPSEQALNKHIDAVNAWGECLADASCTTAEIEPVLQRKWRIASGFLSEAE